MATVLVIRALPVSECWNPLGVTLGFLHEFAPLLALTFLAKDLLNLARDPHQVRWTDAAVFFQFIPEDMKSRAEKKVKLTADELCYPTRRL